MYRILTYRIEDACKKDRQPVAISGVIESEVEADNIRKAMNSGTTKYYHTMQEV